MNEKIRQLQAGIEAEERKIKNCFHYFDNVFFNPETVMEGYGSVQDGAGSNPHWSFAGYHPVKKDRWTRKCKICGMEQHTYEQAPVISGYAPRFK